MSMQISLVFANAFMEIQTVEPGLRDSQPVQKIPSCKQIGKKPAIVSWKAHLLLGLDVELFEIHYKELLS